MTSFNVDIQTPDGAMDCFIAHPDGNGPFAPVILYMDVPGIREELRDMARRLADDGFVGVLPDLYYREGKVRFDLTKGESELKKMFAVGSKLSNAMIMRDTQGILDYLAGQSFASAKVGTVGYCMSGQFVISAAGTFPDQIKATASLYGTRIVTDQEDSPHQLIPAMQGEAYLGFAAHDPYVEDHVIPELQARLAENTDLVSELEVHAETEHGFCFPLRPQYKADAAERVWDKMIQMYRRTLG